MTDKWAALFQIGATLIIPIILVIGMFFTIQSDLRHLETRLGQDESSIAQRFTDQESRIRALEVDTAGRLASIETKLVSIEMYLVDLRAILKVDPNE